MGGESGGRSGGASGGGGDNGGSGGPCGGGTGGGGFKGGTDGGGGDGGDCGGEGGGNEGGTDGGCGRGGDGGGAGGNCGLGGCSGGCEATNAQLMLPAIGKVVRGSKCGGCVFGAWDSTPCIAAAQTMVSRAVSSHAHGMSAQPERTSTGRHERSTSRRPTHVSPVMMSSGGCMSYHVSPKLNCSVSIP